MVNATNRREFIQFLALMAAGAAALPQQVAAFEKYYEANTPALMKLGDFVAVDGMTISGMATASLPLMCNFYRNDEKIMSYGVNLFGGIMHWKAVPTHEVICYPEDFFWDFKPGDGYEEIFHPTTFVAQICFIQGTSLKRKYVTITKPRGSLVDP
jgi:hypothetical protein